MRTKTVERTDSVREVHKQPHRFLGLYLAPVAALPFAWLIHVWAYGFQLGSRHFGPTTNELQTGTLLLLGAAVVGLTVYGYKITDHRQPAMRYAFATTVALLGALFAWNVGTGPHYVLSGAFLILAWIAATLWSFPRLNVARKDSRGEDGEEKDGFWKRLGVSPKTKFFAKVVHDEETGEPVRIEADVHHEPGETPEPLREGLASVESAAAGPPGMASVVSDGERADRSHISLPLVDPFRRPARVGPLSAPGKSIAEWTTVADYANGRIGRLAIAAGLHSPVSTSYALIGITRSGKTGTETQLITDWGSRCDWVCLYLNQAKGLQDVRPILPVVEAAVISEDGEAGLGEYRIAIKNVLKIMNYRQNQLGRFGVSAWSPRCASPDPTIRPSRVVNGARVVMERMPFLTVHMGEADVLFGDHKLSEDAIYIASKALSLGLDLGLSLQKPDWKSMPTNVRSQIGLWLVHGLAEEGDEEFVLDMDVRKAGAHPGKWGMRKPGQHYMVGAGVEDETLFPVALKTRFIVGSDTAPDGRKYTFDELNDRYMAEMLRRNLASAKTQMKLDRGSAEATEGWWDEQVRKTDDLRARMLGPQTPAPDPQPARPHSASSAPSAPADYVPPAMRGKPAPDPQSAEPDDDDRPTAEEMREAHEEAAEVKEVEGIKLYDDPAVEAVDLTRVEPGGPLPATPEDDPLFDPEEAAKPEIRDRDASVAALAEALAELLADPKLRDPKDATGRTVVIGPGMVADRYPFKSRPWFSQELSALQMGKGPLAGKFDLSLAEDLGIREGKYRLRRVDGHAE